MGSEVDTLPEPEGIRSVPRLVLPKAAFKDVRAFLRLDITQFRALDELFSSAASIAPRRPEFISDVAKQLQADEVTAESVVLVCQFLLTVVDGGLPPEQIVADLRDHVSQHATGDDKELSAIPAEKQKALLSLLTPKPARI